MKPMRISVFLGVTAWLLCTIVPAHATPIYSEINFEKPEKFEFNQNKFGFYAAVDQRSSYLIGSWEIYFDRKEKKDSLVRGYYLDSTASTEREVEFSTSFIEFDLQEIEVVDRKNIHYGFKGVFDPSGMTDLNSRESNLWYLYGDFVSNNNNTFEEFNAFISYYILEPKPDPTAPVPEPATMMLMGAGMLCMAAVRRRIKK